MGPFSKDKLRSKVSALPHSSFKDRKSLGKLFRALLIHYGSFHLLICFWQSLM